MLEGLEQLLELQRLDEKLAAYEVEHAALPELRASIAEQRAGGEVRLNEAREALQAAEMMQRQAESALRDQEALLEKLEGQQFQIKSNDAYTALLHEMELAKEKISEGETQILESMEAIESATTELDTAQAEVSALLTRLDDEESASAAREIELGREIERLQRERVELGPGVGPELLNHYERIARKRRPAVVILNHELCGGCRVGIPPQQFIEILRAEKVITCGNCGRILLHESKIGGSPAAPAASS